MFAAMVLWYLYGLRNDDYWATSIAYGEWARLDDLEDFFERAVFGRQLQLSSNRWFPTNPAASIEWDIESDRECCRKVVVPFQLRDV